MVGQIDVAHCYMDAQMKPTHHYPAAPGAVRSLAFPHMFVNGNYRDMLSADAKLARGMAMRKEELVTHYLAEWWHERGELRRRSVPGIRNQIMQLRLARGLAIDTLRALADYRKGQGE